MNTSQHIQHSQHTGILVYCGILLSLVAISVDVTLPFFTLMASDLDASIQSMRATVTLYFVFVGFGQFIFGPLADRLGRRVALLAGLSVFLLGSLICATASNLDVLLAGRVLQGLGAAAGPVIARAMLRDLFTGSELARKMAIAMSIFAIGPIVGPLIGVVLVAAGGSWRFVYIGMAGLAILLLACLCLISETLSTRQLDALRVSRLTGNLLQVFRHPQSRHFVLVNSIMMISMLLIISVSPLVYAHAFGISGAGFAVLFAIHGMGIIVGQTLNHRLIHTMGLLRVTLAAAAITLLAGLLIALLQPLGLTHPWILTALITLFAVGFLCVMSNTGAMIMSPHGEIAGFVSSVQGASAQIFGGLAAWFLGGVIGVSLLRWGVVLAVISLIVVILLLIWRVDSAQSAV